MLKGGMPLHRYIGNRFLTWFENFIVGANITEYHTGYRVYSKNALEVLNFVNFANHYHFDSEIIFEATDKKVRIVEVPIETHYGGEKSYLNLLTYGLNIIKITLVFKLRKLFGR